MFLFLNLLCFSFSQPFCHENERSSLLQFKESFIITKSASQFSDQFYSQVTSWTHKGETRNCCMWSGVECDEMTGHVIGLDLASSFLYGSIDSNSTLFDLHHLQRLDLSGNHFNHSQIPTAINRLSMLTYLNLSFSSFIGQIPSELSQLSKLSNLYLCYNPLQLKKPNLESLISNFTRLEELCLSQVDISSTVPKSLANFSFLTSLQLSECKLKGEFPVDIFQLPNLQSLGVRFNKDLSGRLPPVLNQNNSLKVLLLAGTGFSGEIPFEKLASLSWLAAGNCNFSGVIPSLIGKLNQLTYLDLSENNFVGEIPSSLGNLTQLAVLILPSNHFSGPIPLSFSKLINLEILHLNNNDLRDIVDFDMFVGLKNLTFLYLHHNYNLSVIVVNPGINETFPQFKGLGLSNCNLRNFPVFLRHQKRMEVLFLDENHIGDSIPEWLFNISKETLSILTFSGNSLIGELSRRVCNFSYLQILDISHNKLVGKLPHCLGDLSKSMTILKLRNNSFSGNIPNFTEGNQLEIIDLGYNLFEGKLSKSLSNCKMLGQLNVESNKLSDVFPYWLGTLPELEILMLQANELHGVIGESIKNFYFPKLLIIDLSYNNFSGKLPLKYIQNWKAMTTTNIEDFGYMNSTLYKITTNYGYSWGMYFQATTAIKGINRFYERIPNIIVVINLSNNKFDGEISQVVGNLKRLYSLNLSCNRLSGDIPSSLGNLAKLESLDLSQNELSGEIPSELAQLHFLQYFNVSYNHLSGPIPQQNQLATFERSSYEGNLGLCGIPLPDLCENSKPLEPPLPSSEENSFSPLQFGWKVVAIGYGCGFLIGLFIGKVVMEKNPNWFVIMFNIRS